jgi:hypothetical protein
MEINCVLCEVQDETEETPDGLNITIEDNQLNLLDLDEAWCAEIR